ncbi:hypothetical protein ACFP2G_02330 [Psittacicella hinzii]
MLVPVTFTEPFGDVTSTFSFAVKLVPLFRLTPWLPATSIEPLLELTFEALIVVVPFVELIVTPWLPLIFEFSIVVFSLAVILTLPSIEAILVTVTFTEPLGEVISTFSFAVRLVPLFRLTPWLPDTSIEPLLELTFEALIVVVPLVELIDTP